MIATLEKREYTRNEIADILDISSSQVGALCSPKRKALIPSSKNKKLIDMSNVKNYTYVEKRLARKALGIDATPKIKRATNQAEKKGETPKEQNPKIPKEPIKEKPKTKVLETEDDVEEVVIPDPVTEIMNGLEAEKLKRIRIQNEVSQFNLDKMRGDLYPLREIVPFVKQLVENMSIDIVKQSVLMFKDIAVDNDLPAEVSGEFERKFIELVNNSNKSNVVKFSNKING